MSLAERCIQRPIAVFLLSCGVFLAGAAAYAYLPVAPLPHVDFPTIGVSAQLPGADPVTMSETVAAPLERRMGEIAGVSELTSTSAVGSASIVAQFDLDRDIEGAAHDVQAAINAAGSDLPVDLPNPPTYRKLNPADTPILILAVTSDTLTPPKLYDACDSILVPAISQVYGVAQVTLSGADKPAVRIQVDPQALASTGLDLEDVRNAIDQSNVNESKGMFEGALQHIVVGANDQMNDASNYAPLVLQNGAHPGTTLRLSDIAKVKNGVENDRQAGWFNAGQAVLIIIQKQANANVIDTVESIKKLFPTLERWMPSGTKLTVLADRTQTIRASVHDVQMTMLISIALVILVVYFTLGRATPTLASIVTVPLALMGTFGAMYLLGYTLDNISLMALTVSVGFVVDDAIVMIENITRYVEGGMKPLEAAAKGAKEITFTVFSISISLVAVFIPLLFMGGIVGRLFREFAVTLTVAIMISMIVSLTVTPAFYGHLMTWRHKRGHGLNEAPHLGERIFAWLDAHYARGLNWVMRRQRLMLMVMIATIIATIALYIYVPKGFFPQQDTGLLVGSTQARSDISFAAMEQKQLAANQVILKDPAVAGMGSFVGAGGGGLSTGAEGRMFITLKPLGERQETADQVIARLRPKLARLDGVATFLSAAQDINIGGRQTRAQYQFVLWSESLDELQHWTPLFLKALRGDSEIADLSSDQDAAGQQLNITVDRDKAAQLGVNMETLDQVLEDAFAQRQISVIYQPRNQYHVVMEVTKQNQKNADALDHIFIKSATGQEVRLSTIARMDMGTAPVSVRHQGQFPAATLSFNLPPGTALGEAAVRLQKVAGEIGMPATIHAEFAGSAKAFADSLKDEPLLILAAFVSIYIVLGILYESTLHPITIISTLPSAGVGALVALWITGNDLSLIGIIGVILLMGIVKKNGIMLVDFALMAERDGASPQDAIVDAARKRFRPIMMTTLAAILGALPLAFSLGNGGEMRRPLGVAIVGGLLISQMLTLFTTPVVYLAMEKFARVRRTKIMEVPA